MKKTRRFVFLPHRTMSLILIFSLFLCLLILMILALHHCLLGCLFLRRTRNQLPPMFLCLYANDHRERQDPRTAACTFPCRCITKIRVGKQSKSSTEWLWSEATFINCSCSLCPNLEVAQRPTGTRGLALNLVEGLFVQLSCWLTVAISGGAP